MARKIGASRHKEPKLARPGPVPTHKSIFEKIKAQKRKK